jgi:putative endopeptidase
MRKFVLIFSILCSLNVFATSEALHLDWMDKNIAPQDNFYLYANGSWIKNNPIPPDYSSWGMFAVLDKEKETILHNILLDLVKSSKKEAVTNAKTLQQDALSQKIVDFYLSGMNVANINRLGLKPLQKELDGIASINTHKQMLQHIIHMHDYGFDVLFNLSHMQDFKNSKMEIAVLSEAGLSLSDKDYYLSDDEQFKQYRQFFLEYMVEIFKLAGESDKHAWRDAHTVLAIETKLASPMLSKIEERSPEAVYHMVSVKDLGVTYPNLGFENYLTTRLSDDNVGNNDLNLATPRFMAYLNQAILEISLDDWKTYLRWHVLYEAAPYLTTDFIKASDDFSAKFTGVTKPRLRWQRVLATENGLLGFALGEFYVKKVFSAQARLAVIEIIDNIREVLKNDLKNLSWMEPKTKISALDKLAKMRYRVGYPEKNRDYSSLIIVKDNYLQNVFNAINFLIRRGLNKIGKPVDTTEWAMTPQTVNAYYDPSMNDINLPTAILQPPFFDINAPDAINYGGIGFVIGHEITHGFDDQGAKFDAKGDLDNWWTSEDLKKFNLATNCVSQMFSKYLVNDKWPLKGDLVVGEATADLGGLILAYRAFQRSPGYATAQNISGFTKDQQFFLSSAHVWANSTRMKQQFHLLNIDPHPPAMYRVNGTLSNMPEFQKAFSLPDDCGMVNIKRCVIW